MAELLDVARPEHHPNTTEHSRNRKEKKKKTKTTTTVNGRIKYRQSIELVKQNEWMNKNGARMAYDVFVWDDRESLVYCEETQSVVKNTSITNIAPWVYCLSALCWSWSVLCAPIVSLRYVNLNVLRGMPMTMSRLHSVSKLFAAQKEIQYYFADFPFVIVGWSRPFPPS